MDEKKSLTELMADLQAFGTGVNRVVTEGVDVPIGRKSTLNFALPNWEDPRIRLSVPSSSPFGTNMSFTLGADLNWHDGFKAQAMNLMPTFIQDLARRF